MKRSTQFRQKFAAVRDKLSALLDSIGDSDITAEQQTQIDAHKAEMAKHADRIKIEEELEEAERRVPAIRSVDGAKPAALATVEDRAAADPKRGFASHRDFLVACIDAADARTAEDVADERLRPLFSADRDGKKSEVGFLLPAAFTPKSLQAAVGSDEQGTYSDQYGGFAVPVTLLPGIKSIGSDGDPTIGRTQPLPMATPSVEILARVDKDHSTSVSGGFTVSRRAETGEIQSSRSKLEKITLKANSLFGLAFETEELITDSPISFAAIIDAGFRTQFATHMLREKLRGTGVGEYQGIYGAPATITVAKEAGQSDDTIIAENCIKMASRIWGLNDAIWLANHDTRPQLMKMSIAVGVAGQLIYQPSPQVGFPDMLLGRPIFYNEHCSKLGDAGDLALTNWSQYLDGLYQPLQSAESAHVRFLNHERAFKIWLRNAGAPWWRSPLTPAQSAVTMSPFVILGAR